MFSHEATELRHTYYEKCDSTSEASNVLYSYGLGMQSLCIVLFIHTFFSLVM